MLYEEVMEFLLTDLPMYQRIGQNAFKSDLTNTIELLEALNNPHRDYATIHIAGTNGKGTVAHCLSSILQEAGYVTGLYTSPHLQSFRERIRTNGQMVEKSFVTSFVNDLKERIIEIEPSFFETTVAMAFSYFLQMKVDIAVVETGLGGRLDSTNVISPKISIITSIGFDHQDRLGDTLADIAREKAGIIKTTIPCVLGRELPIEALNEINKLALVKNANVNNASNEWTFEAGQLGDSNALYKGEIRLRGLQLDTMGASFLRNLPTVFETINELKDQGYVLPNQMVVRGINNVFKNTGLRGRWQVLSKSPLTICDVGHNEEGVGLIMDQLSKQKYEKLHVVFGTVKGKNLSKILPLLEKDALYYFCQANVPRALDVNELMEQAGRYNLNGAAYSSVMEALNSARRNADTDDIIFIGGSTFVVAEIENL